MNTEDLTAIVIFSIAITAAAIINHVAIAEHERRIAALEQAAPDTVTVYQLSNEDQRMAWIAHYARQFDVDSNLALQVSRAENFRAIPDAWSRTDCCVGVMQIHVGYHYGKYANVCDGNDLLTIRDNVCYGIALLREQLKLCNGDISCTLGRYSGATNDSTRKEYLDHVERYGTSY